MAWKLLVINGPNLNLLGEREPDLYGTATLDETVRDLVAYGADRDITIKHFQSNSEGDLIDELHKARGDSIDGIVLNAGAFTHDSIAILDAIAAIGVPVVEIHISKVHTREDFRHTSRVAPACLGMIAGFGPSGYRLAVDALVDHLET